MTTPSATARDIAEQLAMNLDGPENHPASERLLRATYLDHPWAGATPEDRAYLLAADHLRRVGIQCDHLSADRRAEIAEALRALAEELTDES